MTQTPMVVGDKAREIIDNLPVVVYRTSPEGHILDINRAVLAMFGFKTMDEASAFNARDLYANPTDREGYMAERNSASDVVRSVLRMHRADGTPFWVEDISQAVRDDHGNILHYDGTMVDITDQVEAEQELRKQEKALRTIHDKAPIAIFTLDPDGRVMQANQQAHSMLRLDDGELIGKTISEFTDAEDAKESHEAFQRIKSGETDEVALDKRYRRADGTSIWGHVRAVAIRNPDGSFSHTISLVQDITKRHRTEEAFRLLGNLTSQVNAADDLDEALQIVLEGICASIGFAYGEAWLPEGNDKLRLSPAWHGQQDISVMKFRRMSEKIVFSSGEGLPWVAAQQDEPLWVPDLGADTRFMRSQVAATAGFQSTLAVAVRIREQLVAVLMFMDGPRDPPSDHTRRLVSFLADRLGSTVGRRRMELRLAEQTEMMEAQIEGASEGILVTSREGLIRMVNRRFLEMCGVDCSTMDGGKCRSMDLLPEARTHPEFMERVQAFYEGQADGEGRVVVDDKTFHRRSVPLLSQEGGHVWYYTPQ